MKKQLVLALSTLILFSVVSVGAVNASEKKQSKSYVKKECPAENVKKSEGYEKKEFKKVCPCKKPCGCETYKCKKQEFKNKNCRTKGKCQKPVRK